MSLPRPRGRLKPILAIVLLTPWLASAADPAEILRRAEDVRSPDLGYAVDFSISVADELTPGKPRVAGYTMIANGTRSAMILMLDPEAFYGGTLLAHGRDYWLLLPLASHAIQLSPDRLLRGDESSGELARTHLAGSYDAKLDGEETAAGLPCYRLLLTARSAEAPFPRIRAFIAKGTYHPIQYDYYLPGGALRRSARYGDYKKTPLGVRSMRLVVESDSEAHRTTTTTFSNLRRLDPGAVDFSPAGMVPLRDAALARRAAAAPVSIEDLLPHAKDPR